jgi:hypothetical protein
MKLMHVYKASRQKKAKEIEGEVKENLMQSQIRIIQIDIFSRRTEEKLM